MFVGPEITLLSELDKQERRCWTNYASAEQKNLHVLMDRVYNREYQEEYSLWCSVIDDYRNKDLETARKTRDKALASLRKRKTPRDILVE